VSIVMPSLNQARFLGTAIDSVLEQDYPRIELIVADGVSTDETLALLEARARTDPRLCWFSAPDNGPAQAVNRALDRARGILIGWLNADDVYAPGAVTRAVEALIAHPEWLMLYGHGEHIDTEGCVLESYPTLPPEAPFARFRDGCFVCQPTVFFRRTLWLLLGPLDETLQTAFDFDYWLRAFAQMPERIGFVDRVQAQSRLHADGITLRQRRSVMREGMAVLARHFGTAPPHWVRTYVDELVDGGVPIRAEVCAKEVAQAFLDEVRPLLSPADYWSLLAQIGSDPRLA